MTYIVLAYDENFGNGSPEMSHFNSAIVGAFADRDSAEQALEAVKTDYKILTDISLQVYDQSMEQGKTFGHMFNLTESFQAWRALFDKKEGELSKYARRVFAPEENNLRWLRGNNATMTFEILEQE